jgi:outer membrane protein
MKNFKYIVIFLIGLPLFAVGQTVLTLEEAIAITLENNFDLRIAKNEVKINEENVSLGNAGMLPRVNGIVTNNNTILNTKQTQSNGNEIEIDGAKNLNLNYGVGLEWTIFDGFSMFARHNQLKEIQKLGETELKLNVLAKVSEVYDTYYILVNQQHLIRSLDSIIARFRIPVKNSSNTIRHW